MAELKLDYIMVQLESFLSRNLSLRHNKIGETVVILDQDDEDGSPIIITDGDYVELYCELTKAQMEQDRLALECVKVRQKSDFLYDTYIKQINQLSSEIEDMTNAQDYRAWIDEVHSEVELLCERQEQVRATLERGGYVQKADAIRNLIDRIECHWERVPTDDKRFKDGLCTICSHVDVFGADGETMAIEGSCA